MDSEGRPQVGVALINREQDSFPTPNTRAFFFGLAVAVYYFLFGCCLYFLSLVGRRDAGDSLYVFHRHQIFPQTERSIPFHLGLVAA